MPTLKGWTIPPHPRRLAVEPCDVESHMMRHATRLIRRSVSWAISVALLVLTAACSTFISHPDLLNADANPATLHCYSRFYLLYSTSCTVTAVDGRRSGAAHVASLTTKVLPGVRWVEFNTDSYCCGSGGESEVCVFTFDFHQGAEYQIKAYSLRLEPIPASNADEFPLQSGVIGIVELGKDNREISVPVVCSHGGGSFCQSDEDCVPNPYIRCIGQATKPFGRCTSLPSRSN